ncbi:hypothetical protein BN8_01961 [Fibrisoma limi BUZ 3]|uniref:Uncharacterized protein n=1 Tax=Fibrisoma limi BUZ 3 TaxID=1185876 RepID=I2GG92_9BACT|nr:hypothetical protein [Fibrisoma limi]CCH52917.1 hypothetical protein BN8_01961 [Fibrisoma limi BUZ 3]
MTATGKLTNLQQELLKLYAQQVSDTDLENIRILIGQYFADRLSTLADKAWDEKGWSAQTMQDWLNEEDQ